MRTEEVLAAGREALRDGDFGRAEQCGRRLAELLPAEPVASVLLAAALHGQGRLDDALAACQRALQLKPGEAEAHHRLGLVRAQQGRPDLAERHLRDALRFAPEHAEAHTRLGVLLAEQGRQDEAAAAFDEAVARCPTHAPAHQNRGVSLAQRGKPVEAVAALEEALRLAPDYPEALYNLGNVLRDLGKKDEAVARYKEAVRLRPLYGEALNNLGLLLNETRRSEEAVVVLRQAVRVRPQAAESHNNLGLALAELGRWEQAEASYHEALRLSPGYAEAHGNLGNALKEQGRIEEALACYDLAMALHPGSPSFPYNRSLALLQAGDYQQGWAAYEKRWERGEPPRPFAQPRWDGSRLEGRTILLWAEQGLGDCVQFVRYARAVKDRGGRVLLLCPGGMAPLLSTCPGVDEVVAEESPLPHFDVHCPLLSLPGVLGTNSPETVPADVPYLAAEPERVARWRAVLDAEPGLKVGIVWQGNPHFQWDTHRSIPLRFFEPLAEVEGVRLVSLQKHHGLDQIEKVKGRFTLRCLEGLDAEGGWFLDTAAVMRCLDLVVCADTAAGHLAGALAVPAWVGTAAVADWRWLTGRDDSPWYPTVRLFRQEKLGDWKPVFDRMAEELKALARQRRRLLARVDVSPGELLDRIGILEIKSQRISDVEKLRVVHSELAALREARDRDLPPLAGLADLLASLRAVNEAIWSVEDEVRACEREKDFGERFVELARSVYRLNDRRASLKARINKELGSPLSDPKVYTAT